MSFFSARVQLPGYPTADNYTRLHQLMADVGFARTIQGDGGTVWHLPHGEYHASLGNIEAAQVAAMIEAALRPYFPTAAIIVTCGDSSWRNLAPVQNAIAGVLAGIR